MNRPFNLEIERELLRAAEENPGQSLVLGPDGIAKPAEAAGPVAGGLAAMSQDDERAIRRVVGMWNVSMPHGGVGLANAHKPEPAAVDWAVVGPKLAEAAKEALLLAVKRQADGGDLYDFQDTLRVCAGKLGPFLRYA